LDSAEPRAYSIICLCGIPIGNDAADIPSFIGIQSESRLRSGNDGSRGGGTAKATAALGELPYAGFDAAPRNSVATFAKHRFYSLEPQFENVSQIVEPKMHLAVL